MSASRLQRWSIQLAAYTYDIEYHASKNHRNADAMSRLPKKTTEEADDWLKEGDQVNRVQTERTSITAARIREACILYCMVGQQKRTHPRSSDFIVPNEKSLHLLKSRKFNPIVQRGFEVGEPVMVKDFRNRGSAGTKGFVQDRLGPVFKLESFFGKDISINYVN